MNLSKQREIAKTCIARSSQAETEMAGSISRPTSKELLNNRKIEFRRSLQNTNCDETWDCRRR